MRPDASTHPSGSPNASADVELHPAIGPDGADGVVDIAGRLDGAHRARVGAFDRVVVRVSGPPELVDGAAAGLPAGPARAEAIAVRLRRRGVVFRWSEPVVLPVRRFLELCRERGRSSVEIIRADASLLTEMQIGSWFDRRWELRAARSAAVSVPVFVARRATAPAHRARFLADVAFWSGVRSAATRREWARLTRGYSVLCYHQISSATGATPHRVVVGAARFRRQLRLLRMAGYRPLSPGRLLAFHEESGAVLPRRSFVLSADDAFDDAVVALMEQAGLHPQMFVPTSAVGGTADWATGAPVATWQRLRAFEDSGGAVGSHARAHNPLPELSPDVMRSEVAASLADLQRQLEDPLPILAYPNGRHDERVRDAAAAVGFLAAYTTAVGRNGAGTDPYCLRRTEIKGWDGLLTFAWKVSTGENVPSWWERRERRRTRRC